MELPRFEEATRRAVLRKGLVAMGGIFAGGLVAACGGNGDESVFGSSSTIGGATPTTRTSTTSGSTTSARPSTTAPGSTAATSGITTVSFTYTASDAGRVNNPFVAVWVEDASQVLVGLIGVVYLARESKYLRELTEWASSSTKVTAAQLDAVSGATRSAGAYSFQWNSKGLDGKSLQGAHKLWIEAAREHGPHSVTSGSITLGTPTKVTIPGNGELSSATVTIG